MEVLPHLLHESMKPPNFKIGCNVSTGVMINIEFEARACEWDCIICGFLEELGPHSASLATGTRGYAFLGARASDGLMESPVPGAFVHTSLGHETHNTPVCQK